jgi:hypothetical protein
MICSSLKRLLRIRVSPLRENSLTQKRGHLRGQGHDRSIALPSRGRGASSQSSAAATIAPILPPAAARPTPTAAPLAPSERERRPKRHDGPRGRPARRPSPSAPLRALPGPPAPPSRAASPPHPPAASPGRSQGAAEGAGPGSRRANRRGAARRLPDRPPRRRIPPGAAPDPAPRDTRHRNCKAFRPTARHDTLRKSS